MIPQPLGQLRNLYEPESGFCISKFLVIQVAVAVVLLVIFGRLAKRVSAGEPPRGPLANLLEIFLVYIRDSIARPAIGAHDGDRFVPLLWTMFMFILVCNLCGLLPWVGSPTASFSVTTALAFVTFSTGVLGGMKKFGPLGFIANQIPAMDLAWPMAIFIKPMLLAIELLGLCIKHLVLGIRLLANMVAGHLVLLGVMGLAFGAAAAVQFQDAPAWQWGLDGADLDRGLDAVQLLRVVCGLPAGLYFHVSLCVVHRGRDASPLVRSPLGKPSDVVSFSKEKGSVSKFAKLLFWGLGMTLVLAVPALAAEGGGGDASVVFTRYFGAGLTVMGAAYGIGKLASSAYEGMSRQPEVAGNIQTAMIIAAALIEGFTFFALYICMS